MNNTWSHKIIERIEKVRSKNLGFMLRHVSLKSLINIAKRIDQHSYHCLKCQQLKTDIEEYVNKLEYEGRDIIMDSDEIIALERRTQRIAMDHIKFQHDYIFRLSNRLILLYRVLAISLLAHILDFAGLIYWSIFFSSILVVIGFSVGLILDQYNISKNIHF